MSANRDNGIRPGVVVLGAGASSRMGRPKLLLPWGNTSILGHLLHQWRRAGAWKIAVVCAEATSSLPAELDRLGASDVARIFNPRPVDGMFSSIQCAATWAGWRAELTHWILTLGDQPQVRFETVRALLEFGASHPEAICQPSRQGRARHPVLLPRSVFAQLRDASEENLKQFLLNRAGGRALCELDDPGLDFDLDEPGDYERALRLMPFATPLKS